MFKSFVTMFRGHTHDVAETITDTNAMVILRQQIRDCVEAVNASRKAVAVASAQLEQERKHLDSLKNRHRDLEERTMAALDQKKPELAKEGAEAMAVLEAEIAASGEAQTRFSEEISRLKAILSKSEQQLRELKRGTRIASATDKTQKLRQKNPNSGLSALQDAQETLDRLRTRQMEQQAAADAMDELSVETEPANLVEKLARNGCGKPVTSSAEDILARLSNKAGKKPKSTSK